MNSSWWPFCGFVRLTQGGMNLRFVVGDLGDGSTEEVGDDGACVRATSRCLRVRTFGPLVGISTLPTWKTFFGTVGRRQPAIESAASFCGSLIHNRFPFLYSKMRCQHIAPFIALSRLLRLLNYRMSFLLRTHSNFSQTFPQCRSRKALRRRGYPH